MKIRERISKNVRSPFYALTMVSGLYLTFSQLDKGYTENFLRLAVITSFILIIELYSGWLFRRQQIAKRIVPLSTHSHLSEFLHHLLLPLGMYISITSFGYFNRQPHLRTTILLIAFISFTILFSNIRAYYEHRAKVEKQTHYVYDIVKFLIFFGITDAVFNITYDQLGLSILGIIIVEVLAAFMLILLLHRHKYLELLGAVIVFGLIAVQLIILTLLSQVVAHNPLQLSLIAVIGLYFNTGMIHHLMHRDLSWNIGLEYVLVFLLSIGFLFGLN